MEQVEVSFLHQGKRDHQAGEQEHLQDLSGVLQMQVAKRVEDEGNETYYGTDDHQRV